MSRKRLLAEREEPEEVEEDLEDADEEESEEEVEEREVKREKKPRKPKKVSEVLKQIDEENLDDIYSILKDLDYQEAKLFLYKMNPVKQRFAYIGSIPPSDFSLDMVKENWGDGHYRINIKSGNVALKSQTFYIEGSGMSKISSPTVPEKTDNQLFLTEIERLKAKLEMLEDGKDTEAIKETSELHRERAVKDVYIDTMSRELSELKDIVKEVVLKPPVQQDSGFKEILIALLSSKEKEASTAKIESVKTELNQTFVLVQEQMKSMANQFSSALQNLSQAMNQKPHESEDDFLRKMTAYRAIFDTNGKSNNSDPSNLINLFTKGMELGMQTLQEPKDLPNLIFESLVPNLTEVLKDYVMKKSPEQPVKPAIITNPQIRRGSGLPPKDVFEHKSASPSISSTSTAPTIPDVKVSLDSIPQEMHGDVMTLSELAVNIIDYAKSGKDKAELVRMYKPKISATILQGLRNLDDEAVVDTLATQFKEFEVEPYRSYAMEVKRMLED